jgi:ribonucleotide monophosphatase NagD (HAD superfamily)
MHDVGATLRAIEASCSRKAFTVGKPGPFAMKIILEDHFKIH